MASTDYIGTLKDEERVLYYTKLIQLGFYGEDDDPFLAEEEGSNAQWSESIELWPQVEFGNVYVYLADCPGYTHQSLKAYKSLEAYNYFVNGWVHQLYVRQSHTGHTIIKGTINKSLDPSEEPYQAWVGFNNGDGTIITGHCTCMARDTSATICTHVVAILFQVEAAPHIPCAKATTCLICPYHCTNLKAEEEHQDIRPVIVEDQTYESDEGDMEIDNESSLLRNSQYDAEDSKEVISSPAFSEEYSVFLSSKTQADHNISESTNLDTRVAKKEAKVAHPCKVYGLSFNTKRVLENHVKRQHSKGTSKQNEKKRKALKSSQDGGSQIDESQEDMLSTSVDSDVNSCKICSMAFTTRYLLKSHLERQHNEEKVKLNDNNEKFGILSNGDTIAKNGKNTKGDYFKCDECGKIYVNRYFYDRHVRSHIEGRQFNSEAHNIGFKWKSEYDANTHTQTPEKPFQPISCAKSFAQSDQLQADTKIHVRENPFVCPECGVTLCNESGVQKHMQIHEQNVYKCDECGIILKDKCSLLAHVKRHVVKKTFTCSSCDDGFNTVSACLRHVDGHQGECTFKCNKCGKSVRTLSDLKAHHGLCRKHRRHACKLCGKSFYANAYLIAHMRMHTGERPFQCSDCGKRFSQKSTLHSHRATHSMVKPYVCHECGKSFVLLDYLNTHMKIHSGEKPHKCVECGKEFNQAGNLKRHMRIHTGEKPFTCDVCGMSFTQSNGLQRHMGSHTGERPYSCSECGKSFYTMSVCRNHMKIHAKKQKCEECGMFLSHGSDLRMHMRRHGKELPCIKSRRLPYSCVKPFKCTVCDKSFSTSKYRMYHLKTHTGESKYKCDVCFRGFTTNILLQTHRRTHTGERPFICQMCDKSFTSSCNLSRHIKIHTGEKLHECDTCGMSFIQSNSLYAHLRTHTGEKPYKCIECGQAFTEKRSLHRHRRKHTDLS